MADESNFVVLAFEEQAGADNFLANIDTWEEQGLFQVVDAVIAKRGPGSHIEVMQTERPGRKYAGRGAGVGLLAGWLLGGPIGGAVAGAAIGGLAGGLKKRGFDSGFINDVTEGMPPNSSTLFLMTTGGAGNRDKILAELRPHKARVAATSLTGGEADALHQALSREE